MKMMFVHQNFPGQFIHMARHFSRTGHDVVFVTKRPDGAMPNVRIIRYPAPRLADAKTHHYVRNFENAVLQGQQIVRVGLALKKEGWRPDIIIAHPGWGESLFLKDIFPDTPVLNYCEFYYSGRGADIGFDPAEAESIDAICRARSLNANLLLALESCDVGLSPTYWQKSRHPAEFQGKISVIFDGIDTTLFNMGDTISFTLPNGRVLTRNDDVITFVARNLEPYRGYPQFVEALPELLDRNPNAVVLIVGGDGVSYGKHPAEGGSWRDHMAKHVQLDPARVHHLGRVTYDIYRSILAISTAHVYYTYPFVLSWSCMEALACGCVVIASSTPPVLEVIRDRHNGHLFDFFDKSALVARVCEALSDRAGQADIRRNAKATVRDTYELTSCLDRQVKLIHDMCS